MPLRTEEPKGTAPGSSGNGATRATNQAPQRSDPASPDELQTQFDALAKRVGGAESTARSFGLFGFFALLIALSALAGVAFKLDDTGGGGEEVAAPEPAATAAAPTASQPPAPAADDPAAKGVEFEPYKQPDPTLPAVPAGAVKKFKIDVFEHVTKVADDLAPIKVWSFGVNGKLHRGTGVSTPMVVNEGDRVEITLVNGASKEMNVTLPHSIDFHSSELAPNKAFKDVPPGGTHTFSFVARHPGVYMYHCATQPVLMHAGAGMVGMMVVKPRGLPPVDRELWMTQQEYYFGEPGKEPSMAKMEAKSPDVIAFNGFAAQYQEKPIQVNRGERIRMYVLNAGPSIWSAFHVIGTVFDRAVVEGAVGRDSQTINLAPSQGGFGEFTLDEEGSYPFVTHAFGDMVKGAIGVLATPGAPNQAH